LAEYGVNHNHGGSEARLFHAYAYRAGPFPGISAGGRLRHAKGRRVTSFASLRTFANSSSVPVVVFVDMQQEYLAKPRLPAISKIGRALDDCRRVLDRSRRISLPAASIRMLNESAFLTMPRDSSAGSRVSSVDEMPAVDVHRAVSKVSGIYGDVYETTD
jgi:hypothetical protein